MLFRIAFRNIWLHRLRTLIVGGILCFGTTLLIVGNAVLDAVETGMSRSIVRSLAGHLQVYSADAQDEIAIFGRPGGVEEDIGQLTNFAEVRKVLETIPNVASVIPMGTGNAIVFGGNALDRQLEVLREAVRQKDPKQIRFQQILESIGFEVKLKPSFREAMAPRRVTGTWASPST